MKARSQDNLGRLSQPTLETRERQEAQAAIIAVLQACKRWRQATKRGQEAMSSASNNILLLRRMDGDWGALSHFAGLPLRVSDVLERRATADLSRLEAEHALLCEHYGQMQAAAQCLRHMCDRVANAHAHARRTGIGMVASPRSCVQRTLSLERAAEFAASLVSMFAKELVAKRILVHELCRCPVAKMVEIAQAGEGKEDGEAVEWAAWDEGTDGDIGNFDRDIAGIFISSWWLQPLLCTDTLDTIVAAFKMEVEGIGSLANSPANRKH